MWSDIKAVYRDFYRHRWIYLLRVLFLQLVMVSLGTSLLSGFFRLVLLWGQQDQLRQDNLAQLLGHPLAFFGLLLYFFLLVVLVYSEFAVVIDLIQRKDRQLHWSWTSLVKRLKAMWQAVSGFQLLPFLGYVALTIPVMQWVLSSALVARFRIPYFIQDELMKQPLTAVVWIGLGLLVHYLNLRLIYTMPLTILRTGNRFRDNLVASWRLTKGRSIKLLLGLSLLFFPLVLVLLVGLLGLVSLLVSLNPTVLSKGLQWLVITFIWGLNFSLSMVSTVIKVSYLLRQLGAEELAQDYQDLPQVSRKKRFLALGAVFVLGLNQFLINYDRLAYVPYNQEVQTIAHRGDVTKGVENSLEALEAAAQAGADYVEMDIILTKDGHFVVSHDNNLRRLTGQNRKISQSSRDELVGLPISQNGYTSQLVAFETYVARAKQLGVKLMVELKPHGEEPDDYAQRAVAVLRELGVIQDYKLMSLDLELMRAIEELAPELETGYVIPFQLGYLAGEGVDFLLVEDFSYRDHLVWEAEWRDQELYVWTINREDQLIHYFNTPVAGLITDELGLVSEVKAELSTETSLLQRLLRLFN